MKNWTEDELIKAGYKIENAQITYADLSMEDHGCITLCMPLDGPGWGTVYGGYCLGHGYVGSKSFDSNKDSMVYIMKIMDTVGVSRFIDLKGKYIRVAVQGLSSPVKIIGNIMKDKWFDPDSFFEDL